MTAMTQRREYSDLEIREGLTILAFYGGNSVRTEEQTGIKASTLRKWRTDTHRELYQQIYQQEGPKLEALAADQALEVMLRATDAEHRILDRLDNDELPSKEISELAGAFQRVATAKGINTTKRLELQGRPTQIVQHLSPQETMLALARELGVVDSTAEELNEVALITGSDATNARGISSS